MCPNMPKRNSQGTGRSHNDPLPILDMHIPGPDFDGLNGYRPIAMAKNAAG